MEFVLNREKGPIFTNAKGLRVIFKIQSLKERLKPFGPKFNDEMDGWIVSTKVALKMFVYRTWLVVVWAFT